eukprot:GILJ01013635.1.p1 GENE.GILJ01013635.1~~GILJ01013635.1.p1  ORF type:complete len:169 (-),score=8.72 GILJ01013635.1:317-823(-)
MGDVCIPLCFVCGCTPVTRHPDKGRVERCLTCGNMSCRKIRQDSWFSFCFIPLFRYRKGPVTMQCTSCGTLTNASVYESVNQARSQHPPPPPTVPGYASGAGIHGLPPGGYGAPPGQPMMPGASYTTTYPVPAQAAAATGNMPQGGAEHGKDFVPFGGAGYKLGNNRL